MVLFVLVMPEELIEEIKTTNHFGVRLHACFQPSVIFETPAKGVKNWDWKHFPICNGINKHTS